MRIYIKNKQADNVSKYRSVILSFIIITMLPFYSCKKDKIVSSGTWPLAASPVPTPVPPSSAITNLHLLSFDTLSKARYNIIAATAGNKILFAGGQYLVPHCQYDPSDGSYVDCIYNSTRVDIYDTSNHSWSTVELGRYYYGQMPVAAVGNKIFFAGGYDTSGNSFTDKVDIYDASTNSWSIAKLSEPRTSVAMASLGNKVFIAGGGRIPGDVTDKVDIYDVTSNTWSIATLSEARGNLIATVVGNKILFAGGDYLGTGYVSDRVDIYDGVTNTWATASLSQPRRFPVAVTVNNKAFFAGGRTSFISGPAIPEKVDIYDNATGIWSVNEVNIFLGFYVYAAVLNNKSLLSTGKNGNIYNALTNTWNSAILDPEINFSANVSVGNWVYFAGGTIPYANGSQTNKIWRVQF